MFRTVSVDRLAFAGVSAVTVLTWYALPDAVRSRGLRAAIKAGLLGVTAYGVAKIPAVFPEARALASDPVDVPRPVLAGAAAAAAVAGTAATVWFEKVVFAAGERRRADGVRCAHTPLAAALAVGTGALALVDWERLVPGRPSVPEG